MAHDSLPDPVNFYGATKIFGERLGRSCAAQYGLSVICLRMGTVWPAENSPRGKPYRSQTTWLSTRDFCQAVERAIRVPDVPFAALFVISDNTHRPWDLAETRRVLGYAPLDGIVPVKPRLPVRLSRRLFRLLKNRRRPDGPRRPGEPQEGKRHGTHRADQHSTL